MKATPAHYGYSREYGRVVWPWVSAGAAMLGLGLVSMHSALVPAWLQSSAVVLPVVGAGLAWIGVWRGQRWKTAHPFKGPRA